MGQIWDTIEENMVGTRKRIMTQALAKFITFDEFIESYPDQGRYELRNGVIVEMPQPTGIHELIRAFLIAELNFELRRLILPYFIPPQALVKAVDAESGYLPDVLIVDRSNLANESLWQKSSTLSQAESIPLIIEVVSTNWRDDYYTKAGEYEGIGIPEYWIIDYAALGGRKFIGNPKQPTISIYQLVDGEYQVSQFRDNDPLMSPTFPELNLTTKQVFNAGLQS
jgi:Uma2 family endonuclease